MDSLYYPPLGFLSLPLATRAICKFKINLQILLSASCWSTPKRQVCLTSLLAFFRFASLVLSHGPHIAELFIGVFL